MTMTHSSNPLVTDVAIIGAGPVGLFAVFELGMLKISSVVIDTLPAVGGQCSALYPEKPIYDIPGFPAIAAQDLIRHLEQQAAPFAPQYVLGQQVVAVARLEKTGASEKPSPLAGEGLDGGATYCAPPSTHTPSPHPLPQGERDSPAAASADGLWQLTTDKGTIIHAKAIILAAGCGAFGPNRPPLAGIERYEGTHVHYMVARREDFRGAEIVIAGGGDSAVDWAVSLAEVAKKIYVVHRRDKFRAAPEMVDQMHALAAHGTVEMVVPYQLEGLEGNGATLTGVTVQSMDGALRTLPAQHLLAFFGLSMELGPIASWGLNLEASHVAVTPGTMETSIPAIFAIGDIATYAHKLKLILCGFAEAAHAAHRIRDIIYPNTAYHFEYSTSKGVAG